MGQRNRYLVFAAGFAGAVLFLWVKMALYDKLEYEDDLFSLLQLSRDFLWGKPLLYENAYGDNTAYHNSYLMPLYAPFTLAFGGKGLFVAGFAAMLWACVLVARVLAERPLWQGLAFFVCFFSPTAFFLWDDYRFGWHPETLFYPLSIAFLAALVLKNRVSAWVAGIFIFLNREDGILLLWALYLAYQAAAAPKPMGQQIKKMALPTLAAAVLFLLGLALLHVRAENESRVALAANRFLQHYTPDALTAYLQNIWGTWFMLCFPVGALALLRMRTWSFAGWGLAGLALLLVANLYAGAYYFPDATYGMNWAPRLAGTYGYLTGWMLLALVYGQRFPLRSAWEPAFFMLMLGIGYQQYHGLKQIPYYYMYSVLDRVHLAFLRPSPYQKDPETLDALRLMAERLPPHYPIRLDDKHLFAVFEQADGIWPETDYRPWQKPKMVITSFVDQREKGPMPLGFEKLRQWGAYEIWAVPGPQEMEYVWGN